MNKSNRHDTSAAAKAAPSSTASPDGITAPGAKRAAPQTAAPTPHRPDNRNSAAPGGSQPLHAAKGDDDLMSQPEKDS